MFTTTTAFLEADLEVEVRVGRSSSIKAAELLGNKFQKAVLHENELIIDTSVIINKEDIEEYQFRLGQVKRPIGSDYKPITWEQALHYLFERNLSLPFDFASNYYRVIEQRENGQWK